MLRQKITESPGLSAIFGQYVGQVVETETKPQTRRSGRTYDVTEPTATGAELIQEIRAAAKANGVIQLRIWSPVWGGTADNQPGRLNLHISANDQGQWVVQDEYNYG